MADANDMPPEPTADLPDATPAARDTRTSWPRRIAIGVASVIGLIVVLLESAISGWTVTAAGGSSPSRSPGWSSRMG